MEGSANKVKLGEIVRIVSHLVVCKFTNAMEHLDTNMLPLTCAKFTDHNAVPITAKNIDEPRPKAIMPERFWITQEEIDFITN